MGADGKEADCQLSLGASVQSILEKESTLLEIVGIYNMTAKNLPQISLLPGDLWPALFFSLNLPLTPLPPTFWVSLASFGTRIMV